MTEDNITTNVQLENGNPAFAKPVLGAVPFTRLFPFWKLSLKILFWIVSANHLKYTGEQLEGNTPNKELANF